MQSRRNAVGANGVKVPSVVNARPEQLVNSVRVPSVVNARPERLVNGVASGVRVLSVVNAHPEPVVNVVPVVPGDRSSVGAAASCACSR